MGIYNLDLIIFENVFKCPKCKVYFLESDFIRDSRNFSHGSNSKFYANMCNSCFLMNSKSEGENYAKQIRSESMSRMTRYEYMTKETEYRSFTDSEIEDFSKKMHKLCDDINKQYPGDERDSMWYWDHEGPEYESDRRYERKKIDEWKRHAEKRIKKIQEHWAWNYSSDKTLYNLRFKRPINDEKIQYIKLSKEEMLKKINIRTSEYITKMKNIEEPISEALKILNEYKLCYESRKEKKDNCEIEYNKTTDDKERSIIRNKIYKYEEDIENININIESIKKVVKHFLKM